MRKIVGLFTVIFFLLFISSGISQQSKNVQVKKTYYKSGKVLSTAEYINGIKNGVEKFFYEDGKLGSIANFVNGKVDGKLKSYYHNGNPKITADYKAGKVDGIVKTYYENGKIKSYQKYKMNKLIYSKEYDEKGKVTSEGKQ